MTMAREYDIESAFAEIEDELIDSMMRNMKRHRVEEVAEDKQWEMWQALQLQSLEQYKKNNLDKFGSWFSDINEQIDEVIRQANQSGRMDQEIEILQAVKAGFKGARRSSGTMQAEFFKLNERKLEALIKATTDDMKKAETAILRMANDQYRKVIFNAQVYANSGAGTYEKAVDMATKDMLSSGLNCIEYANGARHTLKDYADMALRTASKRAYLQGEGEMRQSWGISTVIMNKRGNPCPKCLPFCGKVLIDDVWSGGSREDGPYPLMSEAIASGLYHPRCKDSHTTYFEGISTPPDDKYTKAEIQQIEDEYKEEQKKLYAKRQAEKFDRLEKNSLDVENKKKYTIRCKEWNEEYAARASIRNTNTPVIYNDDFDYIVKIEGYSNDVLQSIAQCSRDVAKMGTDDGKEHMFLVDIITGKRAYYESGIEGEVGGKRFWDFIDSNPQNKYAFIHNHNTDGYFSETDMRTLLQNDNIVSMIAVRNDSVIYVAEKGNRKPNTSFYDDLYKDELKALNAEIKSGKISLAERSMLREQIIVDGLLRDYTKAGVLIEFDGRK